MQRELANSGVARVCIAAGLLLSVCAKSAFVAHGIARTDSNSRAAHAQLLEKARTGRIDLYFLGDSIVRRWGTADELYRDLYANWRHNFHGWNAADFGWGSDTTWNVLWRIENGELDGVNPKIIVVLAGTNDLDAFPRGRDSDDARIKSVTDGVAAIESVCHEKAPRATVVVNSLPPRNDRRELLPVIARINARLAKRTDGNSVRYLDLNKQLTDSDGVALPGMLNADGIHLSIAGYQAWADALRPMFEELLGPQRQHDDAPPPSRNPGL
jgi:lysophospholipase L1-like esterase